MHDQYRGAKPGGVGLTLNRRASCGVSVDGSSSDQYSDVWLLASVHPLEIGVGVGISDKASVVLSSPGQ